MRFLVWPDGAGRLPRRPVVALAYDDPQVTLSQGQLFRVEAGLAGVGLLVHRRPPGG